jgi:hypothetical protein
VIEFEARKQNDAGEVLLANQLAISAPRTHRHAELKQAYHQPFAQELTDQLRHAGRWGRQLPQHEAGRERHP